MSARRLKRSDVERLLRFRAEEYAREERSKDSKSCPSCGSAMDLVKASEGGMIEYAYFPTHPLRDAELPRRSRPANFWACSGCEHCEEVEP